MLLLLHKTLKGSRNIQGFALIWAVLLFFNLNFFSLAQIFPLELDQNTFNTLTYMLCEQFFAAKVKEIFFETVFQKLTLLIWEP